MKPTALRFQLLARGRSIRWLSEQTGIHETECSRLADGKPASDAQRTKIATALGFDDEKGMIL